MDCFQTVEQVHCSFYWSKIRFVTLEKFYDIIWKHFTLFSCLDLLVFGNEVQIWSQLGQNRKCMYNPHRISFPPPFLCPKEFYIPSIYLRENKWALKLWVMGGSPLQLSTPEQRYVHWGLAYIGEVDMKGYNFPLLRPSVSLRVEPNKIFVASFIWFTCASLLGEKWNIYK